MDSQKPKMLTVQDVATELNVTCQCVYGLIDAGKLVAHRIGVGRGTIRVSRADFAEFMRASRTRSEKTPATQHSKGTPLTKLKHISIAPQTPQSK